MADGYGNKKCGSAADQDAQYDDKAKHLLGNKIILAHILVKTVDEFRGMNPKDVVSYIEGEPFISVVPVEPGLTNMEKEENGQRIVGMNTENAEINEGLVRFDIIFYVRMKDGISQVIVNVEAQKDEPTGYHILNWDLFENWNKSHARRRFDEAVKALPKAKQKDSRAYLALAMIQAIYP